MSRISNGVKIEIINRQKVKRINLKSLRKKLISVGANNYSPMHSLCAKKISFVLCDNKFIKRLNKRYFKKSYPTDVISFPLKDDFDPDYLGEIFVSVEEAVRVVNVCPDTGQSQGVVPTWQDEVLLYCIHGILHLLGYDDRTKRKRAAMEKKQQEILNRIHQ